MKTFSWVNLISLEKVVGRLGVMKASWQVQESSKRQNVGPHVAANIYLI